jgi:hypothetical protein
MNPSAFASRPGIRTLRLACLSVALSICAAPSLPAQQQQTTWWPDPTTGLMWTGYALGRAPLFMDHQHASDACAALTDDGYQGWRLPSEDEYRTVLEPTTFYDSTYKWNGQVKSTTASTGARLKFSDFGEVQLWTSTVAGPGKFYIFTWDKYAFYPALATKHGLLFGFSSAFCVRAMEPDLLQLAKAAHPPTPVNGIPQLKSIVLLVQAEDALADDQFDTAITDAKQALTLDPKSVRAFDDIGLANAYAGHFQDALASLQSAQSLDKSLQETNDAIKWVISLQKQAATDPNAIRAWVLLHDAETAQGTKQYRQAITVANEAIVLEPNWPQAYDSLGNALGALDQWQDAITTLDKAVALDKHKETSAKADLKNAKKSGKKAQKHT